jgi:integrase
VSDHVQLWRICGLTWRFACAPRAPRARLERATYCLGGQIGRVPNTLLRHTGNAWAATSGAGLRDLMARMGHDSERAAMIYQHQARGADTAITRAIDAHADAELRRDDGDGGSADGLAPVG